jgi:hypothetical protein
MLFNKGDISLTNVLFKLNFNTLASDKKEKKQIDKGEALTLPENKDVKVSDIAYNKNLDKNVYNEKKQETFNILEQYKEKSSITYDYLQEMKDILKENLRKSKDEAEKNLDELTLSLDDVVKNINKADDNTLTKTVESNKDQKTVVLTDSLGLTEKGTVSVKTKKDVETLLAKVDKSQILIKENVNDNSLKKDKIEKEIDSIINNKKENVNNLSFLDLIKKVKSDLIEDPVNSLKSQLKNMNENSSLPLLGL